MSFPGRISVLILVCTAMAASAGMANTSYAQGELNTFDKAMKNLAADIAIYLEEKAENAILVGEFQGPPQTNAGKEIKRQLKRELTERQLNTDSAGMAVQGNYRVAPDPGDGTAVMLITAMIVDRTGTEVKGFVQRFQDKANEAGTGIVERVQNSADIAGIVGASLEFKNQSTPSNDGATQPDPLLDKVKNPEVAITASQGGGSNPPQSVISATPDSPYRIELLVKNVQTGAYEPRPAVDEGGLAFVAVAPGEEYAIRIFNDNPSHDVGVRLLIDGINMFEISTVASYRRTGLVYIGRQDRGTVKGWHVDNLESCSFLITDLPGSAAAKLGRETSGIGVISATFFPAGTPAEIDRIVGMQGRTESRAATAIGERIKAQYENKQCVFGIKPLATVSLRYNILDLPEESLP